MDDLVPYITKLPFELVVIILKFGLACRDYLVLCNFKFFLHAAQELLFQEYYGNSRNLQPFLRTILRNARLASHVKRVNLQNLREPTKHTWLPQDERLGLGLSLFTNRIASLGLPQEITAHWTEYIARGHGEALGALALACLPKLRKLEIWADDQFQPEDERLSRFLIGGKPFWSLVFPGKNQISYFNSHMIPSFDHLKEMNILALPFSVDDLPTIFGLPSIKTLHVWDIFEPPNSARKFQHRTSKITNLAFTAATISPDCLIDMILACASLEDFTFDCPVDSQVTEDYPRVLKALTTFKDTLKTLCLRDQNTLSPKVAPIASLVEFHQLRKLVIDAVVIYNSAAFQPLSAILPRGIQKLRLHDVFPTLLRQLGDPDEILADLTQGEHPDLRKVTLVHGMESEEADEDLDIPSGSYFDKHVELHILGRFFYDILDFDEDCDCICGITGCDGWDSDYLLDVTSSCLGISGCGRDL
jgi:hypothetical protein